MPASSRPPAPLRAVSAAVPTERSPGLRKCGDDVVARVLHEWAERRRITSAELAEAFGISRTLTRKLRREGRDGKPVHASDLFRLPRRERDQLLALLEAAFDSRSGTHG